MIHPVPRCRVADIRNKSMKAIDLIYADGETSLYKSMYTGLQYLQQQRKNMTVNGVSPYNYALVVSSPSLPTRSRKSFQQL